MLSTLSGKRNGGGRCCGNSNFYINQGSSCGQCWEIKYQPRKLYINKILKGLDGGFDAKMKENLYLFSLLLVCMILKGKISTPTVVEIQGIHILSFFPGKKEGKELRFFRMKSDVNIPWGYFNGASQGDQT